MENEDNNTRPNPLREFLDASPEDQAKFFEGFVLPDQPQPKETLDTVLDEQSTDSNALATEELIESESTDKQREQTNEQAFGSPDQIAAFNLEALDPNFNYTPPEEGFLKKTSREAVGGLMAIPKGTLRAYHAIGSLGLYGVANLQGFLNPERRDEFLRAYEQTRDETRGTIDYIGSTGLNAYGQDTYADAIVSPLAQFFTGYGIASKGLNKVLPGAKPVTGFGGNAKNVLFGRAAVGAAIADGTAFLETEDRLSNVLVEYGIDPLGVSSALASNEEDGVIENRLKAVFEGHVIGSVADGLIRSIMGLRRARVQADGNKIKEAAATFDNVRIEIDELDADLKNFRLGPETDIGQIDDAYDEYLNSYNKARAVEREGVEARGADELLDELELAIEPLRPSPEDRLFFIDGDISKLGRPLDSPAQAVLYGEILDEGDKAFTQRLNELREEHDSFTLGKEAETDANIRSQEESDLAEAQADLRGLDEEELFDQELRNANIAESRDAIARLYGQDPSLTVNMSPEDFSKWVDELESARKASITEAKATAKSEKERLLARAPEERINDILESTPTSLIRKLHGSKHFGLGSPVGKTSKQLREELAAAVLKGETKLKDLPDTVTKVVTDPEDLRLLSSNLDVFNKQTEELEALALHNATKFDEVNFDDAAKFDDLEVEQGLHTAINKARVVENTGTKTKKPRKPISDAKAKEIESDLGRPVHKNAAGARLVSTSARTFRFKPENVRKAIETYQEFLKGEKTLEELESLIGWNTSRLDIDEDQMTMVAAMDEVLRDLGIAANANKQSFDKWFEGAADDVILDTLQMTNKSGATEPSVAQKMRSLAEAVKDGPRQLLAARLTLRMNLKSLVEQAKKTKAAPTPENQIKLATMAHRTQELQLDIQNAATGAARITTSGRVNAGGIGVPASQRLKNSLDALSEGDIEKFQELLLLAGDDLQAVGRISANAKEIGFKAKLGNDAYRIWINGLLSGPRTIGINALSGTFMSIVQPLDIFVGAKFGQLSNAIRGNPELAESFRREAHKASRQFYGQTMAIMDGWRMARKAWDSNNPVFDPGYSKLQDIYGGVEGQARRNPHGYLPDDTKLTRRLIDWPTRLLGATDDFYKTIFYRGRMYATFVDEAVEGMGIKPGSQELHDYVSKRITDHFDDLSGLPKIYDTDALATAREGTFTTPLDGLGRQIQDLRNSHPVFKVVMPFVRTPTNIFRETIAHIPGLNVVSKKFIQEITSTDPRVKARALGQLSTGSAVFMTVYALSETGIITGKGPSDPQLRQQWIAAGNQPYSIRIGDTYYAYDRLDPVGSVIGITADFAHGMSEANETDSWAASFAKSMSISIAANLTNKSYLTGLRDFIDMLDSPDRSAHSYAKRMAGTIVPNSGLLGQVGEVFDPTLRSPNTLTEAIYQKIPGVRNHLTPRRDLMGQPVVNEYSEIAWSPIRVGDTRNEEIYLELEKFDTVFGPPQYRMGAEDTEIDFRTFVDDRGQTAHDRWYELMGTTKIGGRTIKEDLTKLFRSDNYRKLPLEYGGDSERASMVRNVRRKYMNKSKQLMREEYPEVDAAIRNFEAERRATHKTAEEEYYLDPLKGLR